MDGSNMSRREIIGSGLAIAAGGVALHPVLGRAATRAMRPGEKAAESSKEAESEFRSLEARHKARLGVYAVNHRTGRSVGHRIDERFAFCSTYKSLLAARVLRDFDRDGRFLNRLVRYDKGDLIDGDFITQLYAETGMSVRTLCAATVANSDNAAADLLFGLTGGPAGLTGFLRSLGDEVTRSDRTEPTLNSAIPGDPRDTTTPKAIGRDLTKLLVGDALSGQDRAQLRFWMEGDCVNVGRFRAGLPQSWTIADKTGSGEYGATNDIGVVWTSRGTPVTLVVLSVGSKRKAPNDEGLVAAAARLAARHLAPGE